MLIGLMGPAGSGKSTIANYLVERYGAVRYSFAAGVKEFAKNAFEFSDAQLYGTQAQKEEPDPRYGGKSARWFLQRIGTEGGRKTFGDNFWVDQMLKKVADESPDLAVCDDVRFHNEAEAIMTFGKHQGRVWKLLPLKQNSHADPSHASEQGWQTAKCNRVIAPEEYGLSVLFKLVDAECRTLGLMPVTRQVGY